MSKHKKLKNPKKVKKIKTRWAIGQTIGDLPCYEANVSVDTSVEKIVEKLNKKPDLPGVVLRDEDEFVGALSRLRMFEWLGRPYGVELFFKRAIKKLYSSLNISNEIYPKEMPIGEAVRKALTRSPEVRYEPLTVSFGKKDLRLLDINILLLAESEQLENANRVIEKQVEIGRVLSSSLELKKVLSLVLEQLQALIPYNRAAILLHTNDILRFAATHGYPKTVNLDKAEVLANHNKIYLDLLKEQKPVSKYDATELDEWQHIAGIEPTRSWMGVPLIHNQNILGILTLSRLVIAPFTENEIATVSIIAGQAAVALANANLFEKIHQANTQLSRQHEALEKAVTELNQANHVLTRRTIQLETSNQIGQQVTSLLDAQKLLPAVLEIIENQFGYSWAGIWLVNQAGDALTLKASTLAREHQIPVSHPGLVGQSYRTKKMVCENRAGLNITFAATPGLSTIFSEIALPLKFQKDVMGILDIQSERLQAFSPDDIAVLQITAAQISVALRNSQTYDELVRLNRKLQISHRN